jgi:preprotein translocase subunit YajC
MTMPTFATPLAIFAQTGAPPTQESIHSGAAGAVGASGTPGTTAAPGVPGAPGIPGAPGGPASRPAGFLDSGFIWIMLLVLGAMIVFSMMGQRRERRKREVMLSAIKKHDRVQTIGGMIGSVVEVKPSTIVLKVDESSNIRITFARSAIQQILDAGAETEGATTAA